jgi:protein SCO1/2
MRWTEAAPRVARLLFAMAGMATVAACEPSPPQQSQHLPTGFEKLGRGADDVLLRSEDGMPVRWGELAGSPRALFFGFTHCPDICPTTVLELSAARARLGARARALKIDFVTVDPERDTPEMLALYFAGFDGDVRAFAADTDATRQIADAFRVSYEKRASEHIDYTMDHTASVYLIDPTGQVVDQLPFGAPPEEIDARLSSLLAR